MHQRLEKKAPWYFRCLYDEDHMFAPDFVNHVLGTKKLILKSCYHQQRNLLISIFRSIFSFRQTLYFHMDVQLIGGDFLDSIAVNNKLKYLY